MSNPNENHWDESWTGAYSEAPYAGYDGNWRKKQYPLPRGYKGKKASKKYAKMERVAERDNYYMYYYGQTFAEYEETYFATQQTAFNNAIGSPAHESGGPAACIPAGVAIDHPLGPSGVAQPLTSSQIAVLQRNISQMQGRLAEQQAELATLRSKKEEPVVTPEPMSPTTDSSLQNGKAFLGGAEHKNLKWNVTPISFGNERKNVGGNAHSSMPLMPHTAPARRHSVGRKKRNGSWSEDQEIDTRLRAWLMVKANERTGSEDEFPSGGTAHKDISEKEGFSDKDMAYNPDKFSVQGTEDDVSSTTAPRVTSSLPLNFYGYSSSSCQTTPNPISASRRFSGASGSEGHLSRRVSAELRQIGMGGQLEQQVTTSCLGPPPGLLPEDVLKEGDMSENESEDELKVGGHCDKIMEEHSADGCSIGHHNSKDLDVVVVSTTAEFHENEFHDNDSNTNNIEEMLSCIDDGGNSTQKSFDDKILLRRPVKTNTMSSQATNASQCPSLTEAADLFVKTVNGPIEKDASLNAHLLNNIFGTPNEANKKEIIEREARMIRKMRIATFLKTLCGGSQQEDPNIQNLISSLVNSMEEKTTERRTGTHLSEFENLSSISAERVLDKINFAVVATEKLSHEEPYENFCETQVGSVATACCCAAAMCSHCRSERDQLMDKVNKLSKEVDIVRSIVKNHFVNITTDVIRTVSTYSPHHRSSTTQCDASPGGVPSIAGSFMGIPAAMGQQSLDDVVKILRSLLVALRKCEVLGDPSTMGLILLEMEQYVRTLEWSESQARNCGDLDSNVVFAIGESATRIHTERNETVSFQIPPAKSDEARPETLISQEAIENIFRRVV